MESHLLLDDDSGSRMYLIAHQIAIERNRYFLKNAQVETHRQRRILGIRKWLWPFNRYENQLSTSQLFVLLKMNAIKLCWWAGFRVATSWPTEIMTAFTIGKQTKCKLIVSVIGLMANRSEWMLICACAIGLHHLWFLNTGRKERMKRERKRKAQQN